jgi:FkbM family methyltransferase
MFKRYAFLFEHRFLVERRMGLLFLLDQKNAVDRNLLCKGSWEPEQLEELKLQIVRERRAGQPTVFLDIGAHGALYSMSLVQNALADQVFAFEPHPVNVVQLRANLLINGMLEKVRVIEKAANDSPGEIQFYLAKGFNRGGSRLTVDGDVPLVGETVVQSDLIDAMVPIKDSLVVAKIDVEGSELAVLRGMEQTLTRNRCLFQIESFAGVYPMLLTWMAENGCRHLKSIGADHYFIKND